MIDFTSHIYRYLNPSNRIACLNNNYIAYVRTKSEIKYINILNTDIIIIPLVAFFRIVKLSARRRNLNETLKRINTVSIMINCKNSPLDVDSLEL